MKIIKHGSKFDDGKLFRGTCQSCGCKIECAKKEIKYQEYLDGNYHYTTCPECSYPIYFTIKNKI